MSPFVYILLINWNNYDDTIECLESVFRNGYPNFRVIVCDNGSTDRSIEYIKKWAEGRLELNIPPNNKFRKLTCPPVLKPISYVEYEKSFAESGGNKDDNDNKLVIIHAGNNLGYGGGNNVGFRYGLSRGDFSYFWMLNNDTVIESGALSYMVKRMQEKSGAGLCGSMLLYYEHPDKVQACGGGKYNKWLARPVQIHNLLSVPNISNANAIESQLDYISGASCLVSKEFLQDIGLLFEDYVFCFEELDWAKRAKGRYDLAYTPESIVYHKKGAAIDKNTTTKKNSGALSEYYGIRNRFIFTRKFYPFILPILYLSCLARIVIRMCKGELKQAIVIFRIIQGKYADWPSSPELILQKLNQL